MTTDITTPIDREEMAAYMTYCNDSNKNNTEVMMRFMKECLDNQDRKFNTVIDNMVEAIFNRMSDLTESIDKSSANIAQSIALTVGKMLECLVKVNDDNFSRYASSIEQILDFQNKGFKNITTVQSEIVSAITNAADMARKQIYAITNKPDVNKVNIKQNTSNNLFYTTWDADRQALWVETAIGEIAKICLDERKSKDVVYKEISTVFKQNGYDIDKLLKEYRKMKPDASVLQMIAASGEIRGEFSIYINHRVHNKIVNTLKTSNASTIVKPTVKSDKKLTFSMEVKRCPDNVLKIVQRLNGGKKPSSRVYKKAYDLIGIDTDEIVKTTAKRLNVSDVSVAYAIGTNPILVTMLDKAVTEYLNQNGGEK